MSECLDVAEYNWIRARIQAVETFIEQAEAAQLAIAAGATSYTIDTGQTRQTVTKSGVGELKNAIDEAYNRRATLKAQLEGRAVNLRPGW